MHDDFEMSMTRELNFFLGLQIKQMEDEIFFNQSKYIKEMVKKFGLEDPKPTKMPMSTEIKLTKDDEDVSMDNTKYRGQVMLGMMKPNYKRTKTYIPKIDRLDSIPNNVKTLSKFFKIISFIKEDTLNHPSSLEMT
uniref:Retrovirus-related Pol polyprotein from transposon TNT 1-94 n=1 Tax=Tanacetum cinerariifolium TaxID=118510 RepID=A0A6L2NRD3_TANCI|nr:retrovirus-related Pol polyprotein from transposon TNT 1-94 [Tanacetum cinerariifolium]